MQRRPSRGSSAKAAAPSAAGPSAAAPSAAPPTRAKDKLQTAVRALKPQELFALQAENERLLKWEQELIEKAGFMKQQEERLVSLQEQLVSGQAPPPPVEECRMPSESDLEIKRLRAMNEELRQALDLASMSSAKPPELPSNVDELAALRESMREAEARRLLERSEEEARYAREQAAHRETRAAHDLTAKRLLL